MNHTYAAAMLKRRIEKKRGAVIIDLPDWQEIESEIRESLKGKFSKKNIEAAVAKARELHHS